MKIAIELDGRLLAKATALAVRRDTTLDRVVEEGLQLRLYAQLLAPQRPPRIPVFRGRGGLMPGIDPVKLRKRIPGAK